MQIDADPQEDQQNAPDTNYVVENPTLVRLILNLNKVLSHEENMYADLIILICHYWTYFVEPLSTIIRAY